MQTNTKHIPKLTHVYITYANIYQTYTKINTCLYNICKHIPNIYQKLTYAYTNICKHIPNIYQKLTYAYTNICKDEATKHIPKLTYTNMKLPNIYQN